MGLLDHISTAKGTPTANYLKGGRHLIKIARVQFREADADFGNSFRVDGQILSSTNPVHAAQVGLQGTVTLGFNYPQQDLARMRRMLTTASTCATGKPVTEASITKAEADRLCGQDQPLTGAIVAVVAVDKPQKKDPTKDFTHVEFDFPSEQELAAVLGEE